MKTVYYNNKKYELDDASLYIDVAKTILGSKYKDVLIVKANNTICELSNIVKDGVNIEFLGKSDKVAHLAYENTAHFILLKAMRDVYKNKVDFNHDFSIKGGSFFSRNDGQKITESDIVAIDKKMKEIIDAKILIKKHYMAIDDADKLFSNQNYEDKSLLIKYNGNDDIAIYEIDGYYDYFYGYNLYDTSYIDSYKIIAYKDGLIITIPSYTEPDKLPDFVTSEKLFNTHIESFNWSKKLDANTAGKINERIAEGRFDDLIIMQESYMEKKIGDIAQTIKDNGKKCILIAGPSSSGKTSFLHRLAYHLNALGINTKQLSADNFFLDRVNTPKDENGDYDYECIESINLPLLNKTLSNLMRGDISLIPKYDFIKGVSSFSSEGMMLEKDDVLMLEGIHAMNDKMTEAVPKDKKFKIYISALTEVNIDNHNRIATSDLRLLRRICRDTRTRGYKAIEVINMWQKVRDGEEKNIFPYQENADIMFNTSLLYELPIIKLFAEPLLYGVPRGVKNYDTAIRLLNLLSYFLGGIYDNVPNHSVIKEFIGSSALDVS